MLGCIVRPYEPAEFYNEGQQDKVQNAQMVAVITGWIGAFGQLLAVLFKQKIPTPAEYVMNLYSYVVGKGKDEAVE